MGTRNLICLFYKGRFVVAQYCQWDGYPEGQGVTLVKFLQVPNNIQRLKNGLNHIYEVSENDTVTVDRRIYPLNKTSEHITIKQLRRKSDNLRGLEKVAWICFIKNPNGS